MTKDRKGENESIDAQREGTRVTGCGILNDSESRKEGMKYRGRNQVWVNDNG